MRVRGRVFLWRVFSRFSSYPLFTHLVLLRGIGARFRSFLVHNKPVVPKHPHVDIPFRTRSVATMFTSGHPLMGTHTQPPEAIHQLSTLSDALANRVFCLLLLFLSIIPGYPKRQLPFAELTDHLTNLRANFALTIIESLSAWVGFFQVICIC